MSSSERMEFEESGKQEFSSKEDPSESLFGKEEVTTRKVEHTPYGINRNRRFLASGIVLGLGLGALTLTAGCSQSDVIASEILERSQSGDSTNPSATQVYEGDTLTPQTITEEGNVLLLDQEGSQYTEELLEDELAEKEGTVIVFLDPSEGSGLDEDGFAQEEGQVLEEAQFPEVEREEVFTGEDELGSIEEEEAVTEMETEDAEHIQIPQEVQEILSLEQELSFDDEGQLLFENEEGEEVPILTFETERHLTYPYELVKEVKFFVIHYDGAPQTFTSGNYRTVFNTLNGLNREGNPSVQFCVDSYPISTEVVDGEGLGVIHSQKTNSIPYKGRHVQVGIELSTGREDINRIKTARMYEELGVGANYADFVDSGNKDFDSYSFGVEQVGTNYSINFPDQFPPRQQIANIMALTKAIALEYNLSAWDIIAHHEIQEKSDPGEEYMLTLRYLLGVAYMLDESEFPENFLETEDPYEYLAKLREYATMRMGEERYGNWNDIYEMDNVISERTVLEERFTS